MKPGNKQEGLKYIVGYWEGIKNEAVKERTEMRLFWGKIMLRVEWGCEWKERDRISMAALDDLLRDHE